MAASLEVLRVLVNKSRGYQQTYDCLPGAPVVRTALKSRLTKARSDVRCAGRSHPALKSAPVRPTADTFLCRAEGRDYPN